MIWKPFPGPQEMALRRSEFEILYGGARGPGKTDAGIVWLTEHVDNPRYRALVIRKNADDLSDWKDRAIRMYKSLGGKAVGNPPIFKFPSGAQFKLGHLRDDQAYTKYQGHEYQRMLIEELTQIPDEKRYLMLLGSLRSTVDGISPQIFCTTNPGGVGHAWVKKRFVDPAPPGTPFQDKISSRWRIFIPGKVDDNPVLMSKDPNYIKQLDALRETDPELYKAWRLGDWDTFAGQYFREFRRDLHVVKAFTPKSELFHIGGLDWGRTDPFSFHAAIVYPVQYTDKEKGQTFSFYRVITYAEAYGTDRSPKEWAEEIMRKISVKNLKWVQCDNQIFNLGNDKSTSIADQFVAAHEDFRGKLKPGSKERVSGWENLHNWLSLAPDGRPYWLITDNCVNLIRTLPELVHDEYKVEDVNTTGEDHAADDQRYMLKAVRWIDARIEGVKFGGDSVQTPQIARPILNLDLDKFASAKSEGVRDWRSI